MSYNPAQQYRPASFGGCAFEVIEVRDQFGHRFSIHEYPERDIPWAEGLGRQVRIFRFRAAIWGEDHVEQARKIIEKAECGVTERLVHPIWGEYDCKLINAYPSHKPCSRDGETLLDLQFVEAGEFIYPSVTPFQGRSIAGVLSGAVDIFSATISFDLSSTINPTLFAFIGAAVTNLRTLFGSSVNWNSRTIGVSNLLDSAIANPEQYTADSFVDVIRRSIESIYADAQTPAQALSALCGLLDYEEGASGAACEYALYIRLTALSYAAQSGIDTGYTNPVEAIAFMECLIGHIERDLQIAADKCFDQIVDQLETLAAAIARDYKFVAFGLPPVLSADCGGAPLLVSAYNLFGNLDTLDNFEQLNSVQDAMFMPRNVLYQEQ